MGYELGFTQRRRIHRTANTGRAFQVKRQHYVQAKSSKQVSVSGRRNEWTPLNHSISRREDGKQAGTRWHPAVGERSLPGCFQRNLMAWGRFKIGSFLVFVCSFCSIITRGCLSLWVPSQFYPERNSSSAREVDNHSSYRELHTWTSSWPRGNNMLLKTREWQQRWPGGGGVRVLGLSPGCSCRNKPPRTGWLKTTEMYFLRALKARSLRSTPSGA